MFCANCGSKLEDNQNFCTKCGTAVGAAGPSKSEKASSRTDNSSVSSIKGLRKETPQVPVKLILIALAIIVAVIALIVAFFGSDEHETDLPSKTVEAEETTESESQKAIKIAKDVAQKEYYKYSEELRLREFTKKAFENNITMDMLYRAADRYVGKEIYIGGFVQQAIYDEENPRHVGLLVNSVASDTNNTIYVDYILSEDEARILEGDYADIYGYADGLLTYESTIGKSITVPQMRAEYLYCYMDVEGDLTTPEFAEAKRRIQGVFTSETGETIQFPMDEYCSDFYFFDVTVYDECMVAYYEPTMGSDEYSPPPSYRLTLFEDGSVVVFDVNHETEEGRYALEGNYSYYKKTSDATVGQAATDSADPEDYVGEWHDTYGSSGFMYVSYENGIYQMEVYWPMGAMGEHIHYAFSGAYNDSLGAIEYNDGFCAEYYLLDDGSMGKSISYSEGYGLVSVDSGILTWEDVTDGCTYEFER